MKAYLLKLEFDKPIDVHVFSPSHELAEGKIAKFPLFKEEAVFHVKENGSYEITLGVKAYLPSASESAPILRYLASSVITFSTDIAECSTTLINTNVTDYRETPRLAVRVIRQDADGGKAVVRSQAEIS